MGAEGVALTVFLAYWCSSGDHQVDGAGALGDFPLLNYFRNYEIKHILRDNIEPV